ncbi:hypothetical protein E2C01_059037 [Portunus trituberculatus]|uniref:Uncharacterized protein n=1 Tax=Portunus trituberculatus TaxID=210409 RepID=A0A5B7H5R7_PORTR|nr:hypothetical protein [Portunus trituberculatus]
MIKVNLATDTRHCKRGAAEPHSQHRSTHTDVGAGCAHAHHPPPAPTLLSHHENPARPRLHPIPGHSDGLAPPQRPPPRPRLGCRQRGAERQHTSSRRLVVIITPCAGMFPRAHGTLTHTAGAPHKGRRPVPLSAKAHSPRATLNGSNRRRHRVLISAI